MIFENYNNAKQKYDTEIFQKVISANVPDKYIDSACRFLTQNPDLSVEHLVSIIKKWDKYVYQTEHRDINKVLDYDSLFRIVRASIQKYQIPNQIYNDGTVIIGLLDNIKTVKNLDVKNRWCLKQEHKFPKYQYIYNLYIIDIINNQKNNYFVLCIDKRVKFGNRIYWDIQNLVGNVSEIEAMMTDEARIFITDSLIHTAYSGKDDNLNNHLNEDGLYSYE